MPFTDRRRTSRRNFFKIAAFAGTAAVFSRLAGRRRSAAASAVQKPLPSRTRYRLTGHIREYYRKAAL